MAQLDHCRHKLSKMCEGLRWIKRDHIDCTSRSPTLIKPPCPASQVVNFVDLDRWALQTHQPYDVVDHSCVGLVLICSLVEWGPTLLRRKAWFHQKAVCAKRVIHRLVKSVHWESPGFLDPKPLRSIFPLFGWITWSSKWRNKKGGGLVAYRGCFSPQHKEPL